MPTATALPPLRQWSTDAVAPGERLDYWVGAICEAFLEMDCSSRAASVFDGALFSVAGHGVTFNRVVASTQDVFRTPAAIGRGRSHPFYLITQLRAPWHVRQGGSTAHLRPGDAVLVDSAQCYELHFPQSVECLSIQLPRAWVGQWLRELDRPAARVAPRDQGWGRALSALCVQLGEDPRLAQGYPAPLLADQIGAMLSAALEPAPAEAVRGAAALVGRAEAVVRERLDAPGLCAADVAAALGISLRSLHRAFGAAGTTFGATLRRLRMEQAACLLASPRLVALPLSKVGRRCGYSDASHFARDFRAAWGKPPSAWRRGAH